ncbi:MAG: hypothetical protein M1835_002153 [Candelina submexicana]|nr:MAG: hypothetical protein M1835_002153 [Candelina submexicana]
MISGLLLLALVGLSHTAVLENPQATSGSSSRATPTVPQYFQTTPEIFAGPTATGRAPFLAQTNPVPSISSVSFVPNAPLETVIPISGTNNGSSSIFQLTGQLSPYFPNPDGFGAQEFPLPAGANISQVHVLHRHGSRYPTSGSNVASFGGRIANATGKFNATGALSFLNSWSYQLGAEILVPVGRQELFDSGVLHYYNYGRLYNTSTKIIARTTTQDRMLKSAEYFMAAQGFFGLEWTNNATLEVIIEQSNFNISLAGYDNCNNSNSRVSAGGNNASLAWEAIYLANATRRFQSMITGYNWTLTDTYAAQTLCPYETVAFGYSAFCNLFTYAEWQGFEYSIDLSFNGNNGFASPTGRAVGIGYQQEILARLQNRTINTPNTQNNITLDNNTVTFPLNQSLYFDFSHDTNIMSILTAFGLTQFAQPLPATGPPPRQQLIVSHMEPFGARLDIEIIKAPQPVSGNRTGTGYTSGPPTTYIHFILNQRTIPLGVSFPSCGNRADGWCELNTFIATQSNALALANYNYACNGNYSAQPYGTITNGAPL